AACGLMLCADLQLGAGTNAGACSCSSTLGASFVLRDMCAATRCADGVAPAADCSCPPADLGSVAPKPLPGPDPLTRVDTTRTSADSIPNQRSVTPRTGDPLVPKQLP